LFFFPSLVLPTLLSTTSLVPPSRTRPTEILSPAFNIYGTPIDLARSIHPPAAALPALPAAVVLAVVVLAVVVVVIVVVVVVVVVVAISVSTSASELSLRGFAGSLMCVLHRFTIPTGYSIKGIG
jgi:hypothetical protein